MKKPVSIFSFHINNAASNTVDIHIDGDIVDASTQAIIKAIWGDTTTTSYKSFRNEIDKINADVYNVYINSVGGHVGDAMAISDLLSDLASKGKTVNTIGRGIVASSATLILLSGSNVEMSANSWFMMHTVSGGTYGTVDQVENYARTMRQFNDKIRDIYAQKSGMRKEDVSKMMDKETWLTAQQAKDKGFVNTVSGEVEFENKIPVEAWDFADTAVLNSYNNSVKPPQTEDMKKLFADFKNELLAAFKGVKVDEKTDNTVIVDTISNVVATTIENMGERIEAAVNEAVANALKGDALTNAVKTAVENATKDMVTTIKLEEKVTELETEIANKVGAGSQAPGSEDVKDKVQPIGSFNN